MYCKRTYDPPKTLEKGRFQCTTPYVHEDKENLYTAFYARMQENHNPNCLGCQRCGKNSYVYPTQNNFRYGGEWNERPLRENYCTDCSGRNRMQNVGNQFEDELHYCDIPVDTRENYVPVCNTKRRFAKGSMYGCDQIDVDQVPFCKDENSSVSDVSQHPEDTPGFSQAKFEKCSANETWTSQNSEKFQNDSDVKSRQTDPTKLNRMSRNFRSDKTHHKSDDIKCPEKAGSETKRKIPGKEERKSSVKVTNEEKVKDNCGNTDTPETDSKRVKKGETFQQKDTSKSKHSTSVKTEEEASKHDAAEHGGRDRSKVPKAQPRKMPRRRPQRKPQVQHARDSENPANGGVDEWLLFVRVFFKKGVVSALSWCLPYLKIGWSSLMYLLLMILLLVLLVLSCIWTLTKSCLLYIWNVLCSLRGRIFKKQQQNSHETSEQQPRRTATRQRSEPLPEADELVDRLLASKELDAYEVLGVLPTATDEEIKRNYRDMAKLVHPDKNAHEGASEAFQILQSAFEAVGDEEKRMAYQFDNDKKRFQEEFDDFFDMFMERVQEMKNRLMCRVCRKSHPRLLTDRLISAARYCADCGVRHPAQEGDVWIETSHMGFKYYCYLCAEGQVYEVTEWGACQGLLQLKANSHMAFMSVRSNHQPSWFDMYGDGDRSKPSSNNKKKRKSKGKPNKNKKR